MGEEVKQEQEQAPVQVKGEDKKEEEKKEEEKKEEAAKPPPPSVLFVDLHCVGCAKKIHKLIMSMRGVEGVVIDLGQNQVTIKGLMEPQAICTKIMKKTKRRAKVLSPLPPAEGESMPPVASQVSESSTVELNVNMHCEACALQLKKKLLKMRGVRTVETELSSGKVTVTGTMDGEKLVDYVYRRTKKQATIVPQPEPQKPPEEPAKPQEQKPPAAEEKKEQGGAENAAAAADAPPAPPEEEKKDGGDAAAGEAKEEEIVMINTLNDEQIMQRMMYTSHYQPVYMIERIPAPQLFSDENPNACVIS